MAIFAYFIVAVLIAPSMPFIGAEPLGTDAPNTNSCIVMTDARAQEVRQIIQQLTDFIDQLAQQHDYYDLKLVKLDIAKYVDSVDSSTAMDLYVDDCNKPSAYDFSGDFVADTDNDGGNDNYVNDTPNTQTEKSNQVTTNTTVTNTNIQNGPSTFNLNQNQKTSLTQTTSNVQTTNTENNNQYQSTQNGGYNQDATNTGNQQTGANSASSYATRTDNNDYYQATVATPTSDTTNVVNNNQPNNDGTGQNDSIIGTDQQNYSGTNNAGSQQLPGTSQQYPTTQNTEQYTTPGNQQNAGIYQQGINEQQYQQTNTQQYSGNPQQYAGNPQQLSDNSQQLTKATDTQQSSPTNNEQYSTMSTQIFTETNAQNQNVGSSAYADSDEDDINYSIENNRDYDTTTSNDNIRGTDTTKTTSDNVQSDDSSVNNVQNNNDYKQTDYYNYNQNLQNNQDIGRNDYNNYRDNQVSYNPRYSSEENLFLQSLRELIRSEVQQQTGQGLSSPNTGYGRGNSGYNREYTGFGRGKAGWNRSSYGTISADEKGVAFYGNNNRDLTKPALQRIELYNNFILQKKLKENKRGRNGEIAPLLVHLYENNGFRQVTIY